MDCGKKQSYGNQSASGQTGSKSDNGTANSRKMAHHKRSDHQLPGSHAQAISVAKLALANRRSAAELQRRRTTISKKLEEARYLLAELRSRLEAASEFDEDDLAEYREILEARVRDLREKSTLSEAEVDEDQEDEDLVDQEDCEGGSSEDGEDEGASLGLQSLTGSLHGYSSSSSSSSGDLKPNEETYSNFDAESDEESDSGQGINLFKGKRAEAD